MSGCELIGESTVLATFHWHSGRGAQNYSDMMAAAAIPEMLAALEYAEEVCHMPGDMVTTAMIDRARLLRTLALEKAKGETE